MQSLICCKLHCGRILRQPVVIYYFICAVLMARDHYRQYWSELSCSNKKYRHRLQGVNSTDFSQQHHNLSLLYMLFLFSKRFLRDVCNLYHIVISSMPGLKWTTQEGRNICSAEENWFFTLQLRHCIQWCFITREHGFCANALFCLRSTLVFHSNAHFSIKCSNTFLTVTWGTLSLESTSLNRLSFLTLLKQ